MKSLKSTWALMALLGVLGSAIGINTLAAQGESGWPTAPDGWWKGLKPKSEARYTMTMGGVECSLVIRVDKIDGAKVTYTSEAKRGESALRSPETKTVDCKKDPEGAGATMPAGSKPRKVGTETLSVGGSSFRCEIFELALDGNPVKVWHTREIPPIFNQGNVRVETQGAVILLKDYKGPKLSN